MLFPDRPRVVLLTLAVVLLAGSGFGQQQEQEEARQTEIEKLVKQLAAKEFQAREQATRRLIELGRSALPALRKAALDPDAEVSFRAERAIRAITMLEPAEQARLRAAGEEAFYAGDNEAMARAYGRLDQAGNASLDDHRWAGHAHQLGGNWKQAVLAYQAALAEIDQQLDKGAAPAGGVAQPPATNPAVSREQLLGQRAALLILLGRIQRHLLDDPQAAAATYALASRNSEVLAEPLDDLAATWKANIAAALEAHKPVGSLRPPRYDQQLRFCLFALRELADTQEQLGRFAEALETWRRIQLASQCSQGRVDDDDLVAIDRLLRKHAATAKDVPAGVVLLDPEDPAVTFDLSDADSLAKACANFNQYWTFCLAPPAGKEFATLRFDCDIEQFARRYGGQFDCWAMIGDRDARRMNLGGIGWPADKKLGREVLSETFEVEPGTGAVHFKAGSWEGKFRVHEVKVAATFRDRAKGARPPQPTPGYVIQNECLPKGGELTLDGKPYTTGVASHDVTPGRHTYSYSHPERKGRQTCEADFKPGARYGLFINLDSPLESRLTNLRGFGGLGTLSSSLVQRNDGRWLAAWQTAGGAIRLAESDDLFNWSEPWEPAESGLYGDPFVCISPSLYAAEDGTLWMAYFSNRLDVERLNTGGYRLFLTHSKDGRKWSTPRPLRMPIDGWPPGSVQMTSGPDGRFWMFYRLYCATADSPENVTSLELLDIPGDKSMHEHARNPHAAFGADGRVHLVWDHFSQKIMYSRRDGEGKWLPPVEVPGTAGHVSNPQILVRGERAVLMYAKLSGAELYPARITAAGLDVGEPIKITDHVAPLSSIHPQTSRDGRMVILCGKDTVWVRSAKLDELFAGDEKDEG